MNDELQKQLATLAAKLGTSVEHLWNVLIRQAKIQAIEDIVFVLFTAGLTFLLVKLWSSFYKNGDGFESFADNHIPVAIGIILASIADVIMIVISVVLSISTIPTELLNPEYWALHELIGK